jgi:agmatine/peptidylarginine deiminase
LPQYKIPEDEAAISVFKKNFPNLEIIPVSISGIKEFSEQGGI